MPNAERIFFIRHALRPGFTIEEIFNLTKIDRWFLVQIKAIVDFEEELATAKNEMSLPTPTYSPVPLPLNALRSGRKGITPEYGACLAQAAAVC